GGPTQAERLTLVAEADIPGGADQEVRVGVAGTAVRAGRRRELELRIPVTGVERTNRKGEQLSRIADAGVGLAVDRRQGVGRDARAGREDDLAPEVVLHTDRVVVVVVLIGRIRKIAVVRVVDDDVTDGVVIESAVAVRAQLIDDSQVERLVVVRGRLRVVLAGGRDERANAEEAIRIRVDRRARIALTRV